MVEHITALRNPRVILWRSLKERKARKETGLFLVEGNKMVREALSSAFPVEALLLREGLPIPENLPADLPVCFLPDHVLASVCDTKTPQGIAAVVRSSPLPACGSRLLALDSVQDPGNVGTIIRTADAAGFSGVLLGPECADVFSPKVLRATMGSIFRVGLSFPAELPGALSDLHSRGFSIISSQLDGEPFYDRHDVADHFVLIIGNEGNGISDAVKAVATHRLRLPMRGGSESLNASIAAAIMMYDLTRDLGGI